MSKRKMSLLSSFENISPQVISRVGREIQDLQRSPPDGIRFLPQEEDTIAEIHAEIKGPAGTPYDGGSFHIKLVLSNDFPHSPPRGFFLTKIYHPNVSHNGDICVNTLKRDWTAEVTITHVLQLKKFVGGVVFDDSTEKTKLGSAGLDAARVIRCLLIVPFPESSLNDEAGKLFMESYAEYERRVKVWVSVHASKSLSGHGECGAVKSAAGRGVKNAVVNGVASSAAAATTSKKSGARGTAGTGGGGGDGAVVGAEKGLDGTGPPAAAAKRRDEAPRKTAKDRQKEAKKRGLKRL